LSLVSQAHGELEQASSPIGFRLWSTAHSISEDGNTDTAPVLVVTKA
jgi:hypothetical protein